MPDRDAAHLAPSIGQRYVGAAVASATTGVVAALATSLGPTEDGGLISLIVGLFAIGVSGLVLYTVGVGASVLIDGLVGRHPDISLVMHALAGTGLGAITLGALLGGQAAPFGAVLGTVVATIAVLVARRVSVRRWSRFLVLAVGLVGLIGLAWLAVA